MFNSVQARFALRTSLFTLSAVLVSLQANLPGLSGDDIFQAVIAGGVAGLGYAGIGAASSAVEPSIGNKKETP